MWAAAMVAWMASTVTVQPWESPALRHLNIIAFEAPRGTSLKIEAQCEPHGTYEDALQCRIVQPDGYMVTEKRFEPAESGIVGTEVNWKGCCVLEVNAGWNIARLKLPADVPYAYHSAIGLPLKTVNAWGPLYFAVPEGTNYFNVWIQADVTGEGLHGTIRNPLGEVVWEGEGDFDERTKVQVQVPPQHLGAAWSITITKPTAEGLVLDDVYVELDRQLPPFLAPKPEWALLFARAFTYTADQSPPSPQLQPTPPTLPPFSGLEGPEIDAAYSRDTTHGWRTSLPFTYVLDYGAQHLGNPDYVPMVATAPPVLLHLGKDVPFNHGWGPIKALGGENQAYGIDEYIERLTPRQVEERIAGLRDMVNQLHAVGVRWVTPYICGMTLDGDEKKRTGFWEFYDHWDEYLGLGLAPRPQTDPMEWLQRNADGTPHLYYKYNYPFEYYPPFKTNHRYAACWRHQGWQTWLSEVVRFAAKCGYDGVFVDNANSQRCQCDLCLTAFRNYLKKRYPPTEARRLFGELSPDTITWPTDRSGPLVAEMNRFWCETVAEELATLKKVGTRELGRDFIVFPNGGQLNYIQRGLTDADFVMFEKSVGEYGTNPGTVVNPVFERVKLRACNDNILEHKFVQCLRQRVRPIILSRAGYPATQPHLVLNPNAARLGIAECGAFSGGGGFLLRPEFGVYHDALNEYRRFFETHPHLYVGMDSYATVAVLLFPEQSWYGNTKHLETVRQITTWCANHHVLFDYLSESRLTPEALKPYSLVVAPHLQVLSNEQLHVFEQYMRAGGRIATIGNFATRDDALKERTRTPGTGEQALDSWPDWLESRSKSETSLLPVLHCSDERTAPYVRVNAFGTLDAKPARIIVHVVNYNVELGVKAAAPTPIENIELNLPLAPFMKVVTAQTYAPDETQAIELETKTVQGRVHVTLPPLRIYRVVELTLG
ncbi:MAG: hypothetical protein ACUVX8_17505 [Candidatus Zipacnadales bacterium]